MICDGKDFIGGARCRAGVPLENMMHFLCLRFAKLWLLTCMCANHGHLKEVIDCPRVVLAQP